MSTPARIASVHVNHERNLVTIVLSNGVHIDVDASDDFQAVHFGPTSNCDAGYVRFSSMTAEDARAEFVPEQG